MADTSYVRTESHPDLPPPTSETGIIGWLRHNLFSSWLNTLLTVAAAYVLYKIFPPFFDWAFFLWITV